MHLKLQNDNLNPVTAYFMTIFSPTTIESSKYRMKQFCKFTFNNKDFNNCDWRSISYTKVLSYLQFLKKKGQSYTSINTTLAVIKSVSLHCWKLGFIDCDSYLHIKSLKKLKGSSNAAGRTLSLREIKKIISYYKANNSNLDNRDFAIFALGVSAGLRRKEISFLDFSNIKNNTLTVTGKNNHTRVIPLSLFAQQALKKWLTCRGGKTGAIFTKTYKNSVKKRLTILSIHRTSIRIAKNAGIESFTSHDLRRTFATLLLDEDADINAVQRLLGHSTTKTTKIYDRRPDRKALATIGLLPF